MKQNNSAIVYASIAVLSWSTVATAFKIALMHLTHFGMLLIASCTALALFITLLTIQEKMASCDIAFPVENGCTTPYLVF